MTEQYQPQAAIEYDVSNEDYRSAAGDSATFLKGCLKSVKHAMTPKPRTKTLDEGLKVHEFILERQKFLATYRSGPNPDDHPMAIFEKSDMVAIVEKMNESRKPKLKKPAGRDKLLEELAKDSKEHLASVQDLSKLTVADIKTKIDEINAQPDRGLISTTGSTVELAKAAREHGWEGECWAEIVEYNDYTNREEGFETLPYGEYSKYESMYSSLIGHLKVGSEMEKEANKQLGEGEVPSVVMQWLLYAFLTPGVLKTEVSMFGENDKCRVDSMFSVNGLNFAFDLKKTVDASEEGFPKQCARLHYDMQAVHYSAVAKEVGMPFYEFGFIAIEAEEPYAVNICLLDDNFAFEGNRKRNYAKKRLKAYKESGKLYAYKPELKTLVMPAWNSYGPWAE